MPSIRAVIPTSLPRKKKEVQHVKISKYCCNSGCRRVADRARKWSNGMWVAVCEICAESGKSITLDSGSLQKITDAEDGK